MKSILAIDCGSATTTAALIEQIGRDEYRLQATGQAPSTYTPPWNDVTWGVQEAIRHIEKEVGRAILSSSGWPVTPQNGQQGVDAFLAVSSAGPPLRVVIAGLIQEFSLASAQRAATTTYTLIKNVIALDADSTARHNSPEAWIQAIQADEPDVILLVGGTDGGARLPVIEMSQVISMAVHALQYKGKPYVLYAGNAELRSQMADILGPVTALKSVNNVRPILGIEDLTTVQAELERLVHQKMLQLPGFENLDGWSQHPITLAGKSFERLIAYLGQYNGLNVIGVDIGSRTTMAVAQTKKSLTTTIRSDAGVGYGLDTLLKAIPLENIHRWLPFELSPGELYNRLLNKSLYPTTIPAGNEDILIEQAVAKEALRLVVGQNQAEDTENQWNLIVGAGRSLTGAPHFGQAALILLDSLEPRGVSSLVLDQNGVVNMLGAIAAIDSMAAVSVTNHDALLNLGAVIAPAGHTQMGKLALKLIINYSEDEIVEQEILYGSIQLIPLAVGQKATLEIRPARHFDIGLGQPGRSAVAEIEGGVLGIIVDARGRPLRLSQNDAQRRDQLQQWLQALNITHAATTPNH